MLSKGQSQLARGTWCSGITSAPHAEGPGLSVSMLAGEVHLHVILSLGRKKTVAQTWQSNRRHGKQFLAWRFVAATTQVRLLVRTCHWSREKTEKSKRTRKKFNMPAALRKFCQTASLHLNNTHRGLKSTTTRLRALRSTD